MKPTTFPEQNGTLGGGPAVRYGTDADVADLPVHRGAGQVVSCWKLSWREKCLNAAQTGWDEARRMP